MSTSTPPPEPDDLPAARPDDQQHAGEEEPRNNAVAEQGDRSPRRQSGEGLHQVFAATMLAVVGAYSITNSIAITVIAAVLALLVMLVVARSR
ncbi:hypothetical protein [Nonomuraea sp. NPDC050540]|uniref:hypothetical protein n=1 Tax=Nonomuraea sp. NPDC050540 TaxID=3364367 RepID=UPI00379B1C82